MQFGLKRTQDVATCNRHYTILGHGRFVLVYLDNIFIFHKPLNEHIDHIRQVLGLLDGGGVLLNAKSARSLRIAWITLAIS